MEEQALAWESFRSILQEALGLFILPFIGWALMTLINHSKQIIMLETKVNDSLDRRVLSLENKIEALECKLDKKIDSIEANVTDCKLSINNLIIEKFDHLLKMVEKRQVERQTNKND